MSNRRTQVTAVVALGGLALVAVVGALALARKSEQSDAGVASTSNPVRSQIRAFAVHRGDPVNVDLLPGNDAQRCLAISGDPYLSSTLCEPPTSESSRGVYTVVSSVEGDAPPLVIGLLPEGRSRAVVTAGGFGALGESRETVFMVVLARNALGPAGDEPLKVEFG